MCFLWRINQSRAEECEHDRRSGGGAVIPAAEQLPDVVSRKRIKSATKGIKTQIIFIFVAYVLFVAIHFLLFAVMPRLG
jgi:cell division protein FtsL